MPSLRLLLSVLVATACVALSGQALAQTINLNEGGIQRTNSFRTSTQNPLWISKADCVSNDAYFFPLTFSGYASNDSLEVWVGGADGSCQEDDDRKGESQRCWQVGRVDPTGTGATLEIPVRRIVAENYDGDEDSTYEDDVCDVETDSTSARAISLYFMFINDGVFKAGYKWQTHMDLVGPAPPDDVEVGEGDTILVLDWDDNDDEDQVSYRFYCDPPPGEEQVDTGGGPIDASTAFNADVVVPILDAAADGEAGVEGGTDAGPDDAGEAGTDGSTSDAATVPSGPSGNCETSALYEGADPPEDEKYLCGTGSGTSGRITGLINGQRYAVAIASVDSVGNLGKLSNVECNSPTIVNDFYRVYRDAGGQAGGGFCAASGGVGHGAGVSGLVLIALAALGGSLRRRRHS